MMLVVPMFMAFILAVAAMSVLGVFALRESNMMNVFYEDTGDGRRR